MKKKSLAMLLSLAMSLGILSACGEKAETPGSGDTIKIGVFEPLTGSNAAGGQMTVEGIELAHKKVSEVLGKKVEIVIVDNKSEKVEAANAVS